MRENVDEDEDEAMLQQLQSDTMAILTSGEAPKLPTRTVEPRIDEEELTLRLKKKSPYEQLRFHE